MDMKERITECYNIPENDKETENSEAVARTLIDEAIYKAGRDSFLDDVGNATIPLEAALLVGRREVVELLMTTVDYECEDEDGSPTISFWFAPKEWQAKLKEWNIEKT